MRCREVSMLVLSFDDDVGPYMPDNTAFIHPRSARKRI